MVNFLMLASIVIFACVMLNKISVKLGMPMLLAFIFLGMLFGSDGLFRIDFENYAFAENICSIALIFIIWRLRYRLGAGKTGSCKGGTFVYAGSRAYGIYNRYLLPLCF